MSKPLVSIIVPVYNQEDLILRALDSIPVRDDIEVLITDDCSTDNTLTNVEKGIVDSKLNIRLFKNDINKGCGCSKNKMYAEALGKYIITLDSDDYYLPDFNKAIDTLYDLDGYDLIFISNEVNSGDVGDGTDRAATGSYFADRSFLAEHGITYQLRRRAEDWFMMREIEKYSPKIKQTNILAYHYNYPREGSIVGNYEHNITDVSGDIIDK